MHLLHGQLCCGVTPMAVHSLNVQFGSYKYLYQSVYEQRNQIRHAESKISEVVMLLHAANGVPEC